MAKKVTRDWLHTLGMKIAYLHPMPTFKRRIPLVITVLGVLLAFSSFSGCNGQNMDHESDRTDEVDILEYSDLYNKLKLEFELPDTPFDMCFSNPENQSESKAYGLDMNTARWLAFFAGNSYAHHVRAIPLIEELGFGEVGDGEKWQVLWRKLIEEEMSATNDDEHFAAAKAIQASVQEVVPGQKVQFFTAGHIDPETNKFQHTSTQFAWIEHRTEPVVFITFRGTEFSEDADILTDLKVVQEPFENYGEVHLGFHEAYNDVVNILKKKLKAESGRGLQIFITGHSLGAALASLATTTILDHIESEEKFKLPESSRYKLQSIYTFGMPHVGDKVYARKVEEKYKKHGVVAMRFRHGADRVTTHPWEIPLWHDYRHTGKLIHVDRRNIFNFNPRDQDPYFTFPIFGLFSDHFIRHYYNRINRFLIDEPSYLSRRCDTDGKTMID